MFEITWIIIVNLALYFKTLRFKLVSDDQTVYMNPPKHKNWIHKRWLQISGQAKYPSKTPTIYKERNGKWKFAVVNTAEFEHLLALFFHICICVAIYFAFGMNRVSFLTALLYSVNPVNNQGTIWPSGRSYVFSILFLLLSMILPLVGPVFLYCAAWYTAGFLPPLALIGSKFWWLVCFMPVIWFLHSRKWVKAVTGKQEMECYEEDKFSLHPKKWIIAIKTFGFYLTLCLIPFRITFYHNFLQSMSGSGKERAKTIWDRYFWIGLFSLSGMIYHWFTVPWNTLSWALFAFLITILPFCNFWRATQEIAERFAALPNVFLMYALAQIVAPYSIIVTAFLIFYATRTYYTVGLYADEYWITEYAVVEDKYAWWAWHCRAMKRWDTRSLQEAILLWTMALLLSPREFKILINISACLRMIGNHQEAENYLKMAEENIIKGQEKEAMEVINAHRDSFKKLVAANKKGKKISVNFPILL